MPKTGMFSSPKSSLGPQKAPSAEHTLAQRFLHWKRARKLWKTEDLPEMCTKPVALTIAGFDPGSGAGITADLKTFSAHGVYGVACISALTVQSTHGCPRGRAAVRQPGAADPGVSGRGCLPFRHKDRNAGKLRRGGEVVSFLTAQSGKHRPGPDCARSGAAFDFGYPSHRCKWHSRSSETNCSIASGGSRQTFRNWLSSVGGDEQVPAAAARLKEMAGRLGNDELNVVVTGGDLDQPDDFLLTASGEQSWLPGEKIVTNSTHGTGCAFSTALLCGLISGLGSGRPRLPRRHTSPKLCARHTRLGKGKGPNESPVSV